MDQRGLVDGKGDAIEERSGGYSRSHGARRVDDDGVLSVERRHTGITAGLSRSIAGRKREGHGVRRSCGRELTTKADDVALLAILNAARRGP